jgi:hypothetical protein
MYNSDVICSVYFPLEKLSSRDCQRCVCYRPFLPLMHLTGFHEIQCECDAIGGHLSCIFFNL